MLKKVSLKMSKYYLKRVINRSLNQDRRKISPKASGMLTWQLAMSETDNELYLRLMANGSGGLFSKDWIALSKIESVLKFNRQRASHLAYSDHYLKGLVPICWFSGRCFTLARYMPAGGAP
jgi:hypothetical protein